MSRGQPSPGIAAARKRRAARQSARQAFYGKYKSASERRQARGRGESARVVATQGGGSKPRKTVVRRSTGRGAPQMKLMSAKTPGAGYEPGFHAGAPVGRSHITGEPLYAYRGGKFTMDALKRLRRAEKASGQQIRFHDTYRSHAAQAAGHARKPGLVAKPGRSEHERGNAFDLDQSYYSGPNDPKYQSAKRVLEAHGLKQLPKEWWHFSTTGR